MSKVNESDAIEVSRLKNENQNLKTDVKNLNANVKQLNAAYIALQQGHDFFVKDGQQLRTMLVTVQQEKNDLELSQKQLLANLDVKETENKRLVEELNKLKESIKPVSIPDNVEEKAA